MEILLLDVMVLRYHAIRQGFQVLFMVCMKRQFEGNLAAPVNNKNYDIFSCYQVQYSDILE